MSYSKILLISAVLAAVEARFGQEQVPVQAVSSLQAGNPGEAATLAGGIPGVLLAAADPCDKLTLADKIAALGTGADVLEAAKGVVAAEQNFNPFVVSVPSICGDASLPATEALRGIVPLVDPAVTGSDAENANSATSLTNPFDATGLSVAEVMQAQGFSNFTIKGQAAGGAAAGGNANAGNNNGNANTGNANTGNANNNQNNGNKNNNNNAGNANANTGNANAGSSCGGAASGNAGASNNTGNANTGNANNNNNQNNNQNQNTGNNNANNGNANTGNAGNANNGGAATGAADFGKCTPTIDFQLGRAGRKADEGTFLPTDPLVAQGQQDALNPNIIINRVCDQLTNVCEANDAAKTQCLDAKAQILASGDKSEAVAATFNGLLGF
ncbi:hypothetical protein HER10_EVM0011098 [Colletotrichum scovillei]|uniref:Circumsporozoite protein n=1 Tax=Colletotrichum scovillei TaxID=1209932 RepID=A0A9P7QV92_9PEZI|nr:uncharacterized protein HER10_EVM0011098 [Colletotrichum scovillei]KAF4784678.1 hypothetical protein HER10_EVM0011098 [Colletotrichum scovillei]KAG7040032.1 hypothetical protein JMJ78_0011687 [Colletotrichum scovillei]KAG7042210.1 hypothetical protein JMJ77_0010311 [Colletotrichum scovillei]KAG7062243.1 hypothetical protein JMJ76_0006519 [Colletotrichum scovillei]